MLQRSCYLAADSNLQAPEDQCSELVVKKQHLEAALRVILPSVSAKDEKRYVVRGRRHVRSITQSKGLNGDVERICVWGGNTIFAMQISTFAPARRC